MKEIREELEKLSLKAYSLTNLALLLEDYFYEDYSKDIQYRKNQSLATIIVNEIKQIDKELDNLYTKTHELEKGGQA